MLETYQCGLHMPRNRAKQGTLSTKILVLEATPQQRNKAVSRTEMGW